MKNKFKPPCLSLALRCYVSLAAFFFLSVSSRLHAQCVPSSGTIEGIVFADTNNDGIRDVLENGVSGVLVQAFNAAGNVVNTSVTTSTGLYSISGLKDGEMIRLVFAHNAPTFASMMGKDNGSSIQFAQVPACNVGFGLVTDRDFCGFNAEIITTCFVQGYTPVRPNEPTIVGLEYGFDSNTAPRKLAMHGETGAIWGLAWKNSTKEIFSAAFIKQYAGLKDGHDAILKTSFNGSNYQTTVFAKLGNLGQDVGTLSVTNIVDCAYGAQVGKMGLGSMVISPDGAYLYVVNLYNNTLVRVSTTNPSAANTIKYDIPATGAHAFALKYYKDKIYIGITKPGDVVTVATFDPATATFGTTNVTVDAGEDWSNTPVVGANPAFWCTDIDFSDSGDMILSLSDRIGHIFCASNNRLDEQKGDIILARKTSNGWEVEDRSAGEFFSDDFWITNPSYHSEITVGGIFVMPGTNSVVATVYDPEINSYSGGLHRYSTLTGKKEGSKELYSRQTVDLFGKASGFGEIVAICGPSEIEIGNYVWNDANNNGLQDAGEQGLANIKLFLYDSDCKELANTTTNAKGQYTFNNRNVLEGIQANTTYYVSIADQHYDAETESYLIDGNHFNITKNVNGFSVLDNNADSSSKPCKSALFALNVGQTQHSFDIGLVQSADCSIKINKSVVNEGAIKIDDVVLFEISIKNIGQLSFATVEVTDRLPQGYVFISELNAGWQNENGILKYNFTERLTPGSTKSTLLSLKFDGNAKSFTFENEVNITKLTNGAGQLIQDINMCLASPDNGTSKDFPTICDLALIHKISRDKIYTPESDVTFVTTVCNQGTMESESFQLTNYLNEEFDFDPAENPGWKISEDLTFIVFNDAKILLPNECRNYNIQFSIKEGVEDISQVVNICEISSNKCKNVASNIDFDSTPDKLVDNDKGGQPKTATDNIMNDAGLLDEDDHDPAVVSLDRFDLTLVKTVASRRANAGQLVEFNLTVKNEGNVPVSQIGLVDYIPSNMDLEDESWTSNNGKAYKTLTIPGNLQPGQSISTTCKMRIHKNVKHPATIYNTAEIVSVSDQFSNDVSGFDVDSTPDAILGNDDVAGLPEDDINTVFVVLICPAEIDYCSACRPATTPENGQFEVEIKIGSKSGENWFVESSVGLFDLSSPLPPGAPIPLADGFDLDEDDHEVPGHSFYVLRAIHLDGQGFSVRFRNEFGDLEEVVSGQRKCNFEEMIAVGPRSLCQTAVVEYSVTAPKPGTTYSWQRQNPAKTALTAAITGSTISYDWTGYAPGSYRVELRASTGCVAPLFFDVAVGVADNSSIACIGDFNVSLDGDCEITITPSMMVAGALNPTSPYSVMLMDKHGKAIPNATLTYEHIGTKVKAKLIEGCGGNTCWSTIFVEDKIAPISLCEDIVLPCYKLNEYVGPFEDDNCAGTVQNILVNEVITPVCSLNVLKYLDRTYQAIDKAGNKSALCTVRITLERPDLSEMADLLEFPEDLTIMNDKALFCDRFALDSLGNPSTKVTGVPTIAGIPTYPSFDQICNTVTTYKDRIIQVGCTKKVLRNWTVIEMCGSESQIVEHVQTIEITDDKPPVIKGIDNVTISTSGRNLCEAKYEIPVPQVSDTCSGVKEISVTYPGGFIANITEPTIVTLAASNVPQLITYTAYDQCHNSSQSTFTVKVDDRTAPTVICKGDIAAALTSDGFAYVYPKHINDGSFDGCGIDSMKVARMERNQNIPDNLFKEFVTFGCSDVGKTIMVSLRVWDSNGNSNSCMMNVLVQDKQRPTITCPPHTTIDCSEVFTGMDLTIYGKAEAQDGCGATVTELAPEFNLNSCRVGVIKRTFRASDGVSSVECSQFIDVIQEGRFNPKTDIVEPKDYEVPENLDKCSVDDLKPENLPQGFGNPVIKQSACGLASATYEDDVFNFVTGVCFKIVRNWTVIDWCEMDRLGDDYVPYTFQQTIKVKNSVPPVFDGIVPDRDTFYAEKGNCIDAPVSLTVSATDRCTPKVRLRWNYKIDYLNNGSIDVTNAGIGGSATINSRFVLGLHKVIWSFEDQCGNVVTKEQLIFVANNDKPTASGLESVSIGIVPWDTNNDGIPDIERGCIKASSLNTSSVSVCCTTPLRFSFSANINDTIACFDCFDVGKVNTVELWVHDCFGNTDFVEVNVDVEDNNNSNVCAEICKNNTPTPSVTGPNNICQGQSSTLTATGGKSYVWSTITADTTASITVSPAVTTTYTVTVTNEIGCSATASRTVTVRPRPTAAITGNDVCNGSSTILTASGGGTYLWSTGATTTTITVSPTTATTYTVTVTATNGCTATATRTVQVRTNPTIGIAGNNTVCTGSSTTLTANGATSYIWSTGATTNAITVSPTTATTYRVTGTDAGGCTGTASINVSVNPLPNGNIQGNTTICTGGSTMLTATGGVAYLWSTLATTDKITVNPTTNTTYTVRVTDANGCSVMVSRLVTVNPLPTANITGNNTVCIGDSTTLIASGGVSYLWSNNATTAQIRVAPAVTTTYTVTVTNANACTNTATRTVTVNARPTPSIQGINAICTGQGTTLTASGGVSYLWSTGATTASVNVVPATTTTYTVTVTNANACTATATRVVTVNALPQAAISGNLLICLNSSTTLTASGGGTYLWSTGATTAAITVTPLTNTTYTVTVTNANGCVASTSATVMVDPGVLTCTTQNKTVYLGPNGSVSIVPMDISTGNNGACTNITATVNPNQFFCNDVGAPVVVTLTVTNTNTNQSVSCTAQVTVRDTIRPTITCPGNVTVPCDEFNPNAPLTVYGTATASDNCLAGLNITVLPISNLNQCNVGQITRTFTARDNSNNTRQCVQLINIVNNNPVSLANITFPPDITVSNCQGTTPAVTGNTFVNTAGADCSDVSISFTDDAPSTNPLCRDTIFRTWVVRDTCQFQVGTSNGIFTRVQRIVVTVQPPSITGPANTTIFVDPVTCSAALANVLHTANGCNLVLSNSVNNLPSFNYTGNYTTNVNIVLTARETCSNLTTTFNFNVVVIDTSSTNFACRKTFPPIQDTDPPMAFDIVRNHAIIDIGCNDDLVVVPSYSRTDINDTLRIYDCDDILIDFPIRVYFWVNGVVTDSCNSLATPVDLSQNGFCSQGLVTIGGNVATEAGQRVSNVKVALQGSEAPENVTNTEGHYRFPWMEAGGEYAVAPYKNDLPLEGVSTLDLVLIQRHILQAEALKSPYQIIAADVNKDDKVSASDLLQLRKLILGIYSAFPNNTSWRMIDKNYVFPDPKDPFLTLFPEKYFIPSLNENMLVNWVGVKTGDVNGSYTANANNVSTGNRDKNWSLVIEDKMIHEVEDLLPVKASEATTLNGFQISFKVANAADVTLSSGVLDMTDVNYMYANGILNISWSDVTAKEIAADEVLFYIHIKGAGRQFVSSMMQVRNNGWNNEYYPTPVSSLPVGFMIKTDPVNEFTALGNQPNPWNQQTSILFALPERGEVGLRIKDVNGREVFATKEVFNKGQNVFLLNQEQIGVTGILFYELTFRNEVKTMKMINLR